MVSSEEHLVQKLPADLDRVKNRATLKACIAVSRSLSNLALKY